MVIPIILFNTAVPEKAEATWICEFYSGTVYNVTIPLTIRQSGYEDITLKARYETKPFESPFYYVIRIAGWNGNGAWEVEFIHHKLFLRNRPPEVQQFSITHGYNILMVNRAQQFQGFIFHLGAGVVIAHPETVVRNRRHSERRGIFHRGYYISGQTVHIAVGKRLPLGKKLTVIIEGKFTGSYNRIPIADGNAVAPNVAVHSLFGLGYRF